jgi:hypothetical protein
LNGTLVLTTETFIWGVQSICLLHLLPCNPELVLRQFSPPYDVFLFQQAATALGLRSGLKAVLPPQLPHVPVPFVAVLSGTPSGLAIVLKCDERAITYLEESTSQARTQPLSEFALQFTSTVMLCAPHAARPKTENHPREARQ